jgi:hypothetical protein
MLNLVTLFKCTSNDENQKKELFNLSEVITSISHRLAAVTTNKSKFILEFEQDVPENVYGDMTKFQQVITTLINFTNINSPVDDVVGIYWKLDKIDDQRRYQIETKIDITNFERINIVELREIFKNNKLDLDFFIRYKLELQSYDFGVLICSYLVKQWEGFIEIREKNEKVHIILKMPFLPFDPNFQGPNALNVSSVNQFAENIMRQSFRDDPSKPSAFIEGNLKEDLNLTRKNVSPSSGNAIRNHEQSQISSSKYSSDKLPALMLKDRRASAKNRHDDQMNGDDLSSKSRHGKLQMRPGLKLSSKSGILFNQRGDTIHPRKYKTKKHLKTHKNDNDRIQGNPFEQNERFNHRQSIRMMTKSNWTSDGNVIMNWRNGPRMSIVMDSNSPNLPPYIKENIEEDDSNFDEFVDRNKNRSRAMLYGIPDYDMNSGSVR